MTQTRVPTQFRLGDRLVQRGLISEQQLEEALEAQVIYGGHLGTCLIEKGFVGEGPLGEVLAESSGLQLATPDVFMDIPPYVVESLSQRMAHKHLAMPFRRVDKELHVALMDAKDLRVLDELAFASGCKIVPWIAPEVRILQALERYYRLPRRPRYVSICRQLDEDLPEIVPLDMSNPQAIVSGGGRGAHKSGARSSKPPARPRTAATRSRPAATRPASTPTPTRAADIQQATELLCRVRTEAQAVRVALDFAAEHATRVLLFRMGAGTAELWDARGCPAAPDKTPVSFSIMKEPLFGLLVGQPDFVGPLPTDGSCSGFYERLHLEPPRDLLLLPLAWEGRLQALLYADAGEDTGQGPDAALFRRLAGKLACSLQLARIRAELQEL